LKNRTKRNKTEIILDIDHEMWIYKNGCTGTEVYWWLSTEIDRFVYLYMFLCLYNAVLLWGCNKDITMLVYRTLSRPVFYWSFAQPGIHIYCLCYGTERTRQQAHASDQKRMQFVINRIVAQNVTFLGKRSDLARNRHNWIFYS